MIIPADYDEKEFEVKLTQAEIDVIKEELKRTEHNIYEFLNYKSIINKLQSPQELKQAVDSEHFEKDEDKTLDIPYPAGHNWEGLTPRQVNQAYDKIKMEKNK